MTGLLGVLFSLVLVWVPVYQDPPELPVPGENFEGAREEMRGRYRTLADVFTAEYEAWSPTPLDLSTFERLRGDLTLHPVALDQRMVSRFVSLEAYTTEFFVRGGVDGDVALSASRFSRLVATLGSDPEFTLSAPSLGSYSGAVDPVTDEDKLFGLLWTSAWTEVSNSDGLGSRLGGGPERAAWDAAVRSANSRLQSGLEGLLPNPCHNAFLSSMSGSSYSSGGRDCSVCVAAGNYMKHQMRRLTDPGYDAPSTSLPSYQTSSNSVSTVTKFTPWGNVTGSERDVGEATSYRRGRGGAVTPSTTTSLVLTGSAASVACADSAGPATSQKLAALSSNLTDILGS